MIHKFQPIFNYMNPATRSHSAITDYQKLTKTRYKVAAIAAALFASIVPIAGTTAAFRAVVGHFTKRHAPITLDEFPTSPSDPTTETHRINDLLHKILTTLRPPPPPPQLNL